MTDRAQIDKLNTALEADDFASMDEVLDKIDANIIDMTKATSPNAGRTRYNAQGELLFPFQGELGVVIDQLEPINYIVVPTPAGLALRPAGQFVLPRRIYGDVTSLTTRVLDTFASRKNSTGIGLVGDKGSGKTLQAQDISVTGYARGLPTIIVNLPLHGDSFNRFITSIQQPAIILFDEYEKVYRDSDAQEGLLTLLDGLFPSKKLFIMTSNSYNGLNEYMRERPGRIYYVRKYRGMTRDAITDYIKSELKNKNRVNRTIEFAMMLADVSFDCLKAIVEEMNRYNLSVAAAVRDLNIKLTLDEAFYEISGTYKGTDITSSMDETSRRGSPMNSVSRAFVLDLPKIDGSILADLRDTLVRFPENEELMDRLKALRIDDESESCYVQISPDKTPGAEGLEVEIPLEPVAEGKKETEEFSPVVQRLIEGLPRLILLIRTSQVILSNPETGKYVFQSGDFVITYTRRDVDEFSWLEALQDDDDVAPATGAAPAEA